MQYRREIDGLRAIAVVPVILFHAGLNIFQGGYVGVDVFFVISGYLITSIILLERQAGTFSISKFYERRARRILPALFVVIVACLPFAWAWMVPHMLEDFARSVVATALFISNIHFWETTDYFATDTELKPLLHTWSLAVEEQFYLIFPLLLGLLGARKLRLTTAVLVAIALASLALSEWGWRNEPDANFYFSLSRFWELLVGALCAIYLLKREPHSNNILSFFGLFLILFSVFVFDETYPFPSVYTLVPVIGTALIVVFAGTRSFVARVLSTKPLVGIGLISYSAYLWHQPLFAFAKLRALPEPGLPLMLMLCGATFGLAYLSWQFVEQPFRRRPLPVLPTRAQVFGVSGAGMAALIALGVWVDKSGGAPFRIAPNGIKYSALSTQAQLAGNPGLSDVCSEEFTTAINAVPCQTAENPGVLLWGDSYAMHLAPWLAEGKSADAVGLKQITMSQCWPILNVTPDNLAPSRVRECIAFNDRVLQWLSEQDSISTVILASRFRTRGLVRGRNDATIDHAVPTYVAQQITQTVETLRAMGKKVIVISPPPSNGSDLGICLLRASLWGDTLTMCDYETDEYSTSITKAYELLQRVEAVVPVLFLDSLVFCADQTCMTSIDDVHLYRDDGHLSLESAGPLGERMDLFSLALSRAQ